MKIMIKKKNNYKKENNETKIHDNPRECDMFNL